MIRSGGSKTPSRESLISNDQISPEEIILPDIPMGNVVKFQADSGFPMVIPEDQPDQDDPESQESLTSKETDLEYEPSEDLITPEREDTTEVKKRKFYKYMLAGYMLICIAVLCYTLLLLTAQLTVHQISIFEMGVFKCLIQLCTAGSSVIILRLPWKLNWQHFHLAFLAAICEYVGNACFYTASALIPMPNLQVLFAVLNMVLSAIVDTIAGRLNFNSIICSIISSTGMLLMVRPWVNNKIDILMPAPCEVMSTFPVHANGTDDFHNTTEIPLSSSDQLFHTERVVSVIGFNVDATITGYLLVFFGSIATTAFYNFIQILGQLYPIPTTILWIGGTESCLSFLLAIVINRWNRPHEHWCIIFIICYIIMKVALTFAFYFAFYFLKISHVLTTLSVSFILVNLFQNSFLSVFYPNPQALTEVAGTFLVAIGVMLFPCLLIMSKHNPYKIPEVCDARDSGDDF